MDDAQWDTIARLVSWLDEGSPVTPEMRTVLQVLKISEEAGETAQAVIGATGQNPRKGFSHTWDDVQKEICDVIISAMVALTRLSPDAREVFAANLQRVEQRSEAARVSD